MKPSKPFVMPPVRIIPPTLEGQSESSKSLEEWLNTEETVRDLHFGKRTEEHMAVFLQKHHQLYFQSYPIQRLQTEILPFH